MLHHVSAAELKAANMVKLPLRVITRHPSQKDALFADAITLRADLEKLAAAEAQATGEYLRPIMLLQAERVDACEPLRERLVTEFGLTGAIDPLEELANICAARGVWLHVDGAYGLPGAAVLEMRERFKGLEQADSISVDAHKWLYLPKACGVVLVKHRSTLAAAFTHDESYMLHDEHQPYNAVDLTLEYSRPFRALKLWLALRVHGADQFRAAIKRNLEQAQLCAKLVRASSELELLVEPQLSTVPFRHVPLSLKGDETALNHHNLELVRAMQEDGRVYISSALVAGKICLRPCFVNFRSPRSRVPTADRGTSSDAASACRRRS